jgi:hypothetical protein
MTPNCSLRHGSRRAQFSSGDCRTIARWHGYIRASAGFCGNFSRGFPSLREGALCSRDCQSGSYSTTLHSSAARITCGIPARDSYSSRPAFQLCIFFVSFAPGGRPGWSRRSGSPNFFNVSLKYCSDGRHGSRVSFEVFSSVLYRATNSPSACLYF